MKGYYENYYYSIFVFLLLTGTGCASNDYAAYGQAQAAVATAKATADTARYQALSKIAESGNESSRIAAVMALALGNNTQTQSTQIAPPQPSQALQWAQVLAPSLTSIASMHYTSRTSMANAESAARVSESTNSAFLGIASKIQAPVVAAAVVPASNISTVNNTTTTTTSSANQANVTTASTSNTNTATTNTANPTVTIGGTGVVGSGTASTAANPVTTTTNPSTQIPAGTVCTVTETGNLDCKP